MSNSDSKEESPLIDPPITVQYETTKELFLRFVRGDPTVFIALVNLLIISVSIFTTLYALKLSLHEDFDLSDTDTGLIYALIGIFVVIYLLIMGTLVDKFGYN